MIWSHVTTSGYAAAGGVDTTARWDDPPRHDTDTAPPNTTTMSTLALDPTVRSYARELSVAEPVRLRQCERLGHEVALSWSAPRRLGLTSSAAEATASSDGRPPGAPRRWRA